MHCYDKTMKSKKDGGFAGMFKQNTMFTKRLNIDTLIFFCNVMSSSLKAGIDVGTALGNISKDIVKNRLNRDFAGVLLEVKDKIAKGSTFTEAVATHLDYFPQNFIQFVRIGELSGNLDKQLIKVVELAIKEKQKVEAIDKALHYPKINAITTIAWTLFTWTFLVPWVKAGFSIGTETVEGSGFLEILIGTLLSSALLPAFIFIFSILALNKFFKSNKGINFKLSMLSFIPGFAGVLKNTSIATFFRTSALLVDGGLIMADAISISADNVDNEMTRNVGKSIGKSILDGMTLFQSFEKENYFDSTVTSMVANAEISGDYSFLFRESARVYEEKANAKLEKFLSLIRPIFTGITVFVGFSQLILMIFAVVLTAIETSL